MLRYCKLGNMQRLLCASMLVHKCKGRQVSRTQSIMIDKILRRSLQNICKSFQPFIDLDARVWHAAAFSEPSTNRINKRGAPSFGLMVSVRRSITAHQARLCDKVCMICLRELGLERILCHKVCAIISIATTISGGISRS